MTETHLSDRMPDVAHGRDTWTVLDQEHLSGCEDCRGEWTLVQRGSRLGSEIDGSLDLSALTEKVSTRVVAARRARIMRFRSARWFIPMAAAAALLIMLTRSAPSPAGADSYGLITAVLLPELELLSEEELELVFDVVPAATNPLEQGIPGVTDLGEEELERLLRTLEG